MCDITSGMVANYVAATRGSLVQKNSPFVWKNKDIFCRATGRKSRWSQISVTLTKILYKPLVTIDY